MRAIRRRVSLLAAAAVLLLLPCRPRLAWAEEGDELRPCTRLFDARAFAAAQACLSVRAGKQPADAAALFYLGRTYYERRQPGLAIDWLKRAVAREPGRSDFHDWLGRAYGIAAQRAAVVRQFGLAVKARQEFARAVELDPANADALEDLIEFQIQAPVFLGGSREQASRHAAELERRDPLRGRLARAEILLRQPAAAPGPAVPAGAAAPRGPEGLPAAERLLRAAAADFPGDPRPRLALADAYEQAGRLEQAADELEAVLRLDPDNADAHGALARVAAVSGRRLDRAEELLTRDLQRLPPEDDAALADCHYAPGGAAPRSRPGHGARRAAPSSLVSTARAGGELVRGLHLWAGHLACSRPGSATEIERMLRATWAEGGAPRLTRGVDVFPRLQHQAWLRTRYLEKAVDALREWGVVEDVGVVALSERETGRGPRAIDRPKGDDILRRNPLDAIGGSDLPHRSWRARQGRERGTTEVVAFR
jgi:tetratricopeptide (TPR) repeat protein